MYLYGHAKWEPSHWGLRELILVWGFMVANGQWPTEQARFRADQAWNSPIIANIIAEWDSKPF